MRIEAPTETLQRFTKDSNWISQPVETIANDLKSSGNESRHEWDAFYYEERNGRLFDPVRSQNILETHGEDPAQKKVNKELEDWFLSHDSGIAVRISPKGGIYHYPNEQIEIYRIAYSWPTLQKRLFCSFRQFDANLGNPEKIRQSIFPEEDTEEAIFQVIKWVEKMSQKTIETNLRDEKLRSDQAYHYALMLKSGADPRLIFENMTQTGFLGEHAIGCGGSTSTLSSSLTETFTLVPNYNMDQIESWHEGTCRICGITTLVGPCSICKPCESKL